MPDVNVTADRDRMQGALDRLEAHWRSVDAPVLRLARPGLSEDRIAELTARCGLVLPVDARYWFTWRDGVSVAESGQATMGPRFYLPSLEDQVNACLEEREWAIRMSDEGGPEDPNDSWSHTWFPIIPDSIGHGPVIIDTAVPAGTEGPVGHLGNDSTTKPGEGRTLTTLVEFWVDCHDRGLYEWQPDRQMWFGRSVRELDLIWLAFYH